MVKEEITLSKTSLTLIYATYKVNLSLLKTSYSLVTIVSEIVNILSKIRKYWMIYCTCEYEIFTFCTATEGKLKDRGR